MTNPKLEQLKQRLAETQDLTKAATLLFWDQRVMMPPGGAEARAEASATVSSLAQERFVADDAPVVRRHRHRVPAGVAHSAAEGSLDGPAVAREASGRQEIGGRGPAESLESRRRGHKPPSAARILDRAIRSPSFV